ncbi:permease [Pseudoalteromonas sp. PS5]|uniref:permease n=1 Tax=Pseudoalteromonas sp. PS5 TaxID=1437473 RepID=UPI000FFED6EE|nr:permease [Pseudoalteromonas sp. PS5]RXF03289.1 permease [Pseudoalteromonas sp. PS5]
MSTEFISMANETLNMFMFLAIELTILYIVISYAIGVLQEYVPKEKVQTLLASQNGRGYVIAAVLGAITPFCSCSTIPFLKGLLKARAGFGPTIVFLLSSPLLNPLIIGILAVTFSIQLAVFYFVIAMVVSISAGVLLEKLGFEKYVRPETYAEQEKSCTPSNKSSEKPSTEPNRWIKIWRSTWKDFKKTLPYLLVGVSIGSIIYGFVPTELIVKYAGENKWYAIPIAAVIGIPLYIRASAIIPLSAGLVKKGMAMGSVMALIIGSAGASLTEVILLRSIFEKQMIAAFLTVVLGMAMAAGYLYSVVF